MHPIRNAWYRMPIGHRILLMKPSKKHLIGYWVSTALVALAMISGGIGDLVKAQPVLEGMVALGYPLYFMTILGAWKVLGGAVILAPGLPRLKEWAYAGIVFDLTGAALSHAFAGDPAAKLVNPLILTGIALASWALRPTSRRLPSPAVATAPVAERQPVAQAA
jgi:hypothetical protein